MKDKTELAEKLYDAVGGIDSRYVQEACAPFRKRKSRTVLKVVLLAAAIQALIVAMLVGTVALGMVAMLGQSKSESANGNADNKSDSETAEPVPGVLSVSTVAPQNIDLFSGSCAVVIQYKEGGEYTVITVTESKMNSLMTMYRRERSMPSDGRYNDVKVWLCDKNGVVISPHLKESSGNVGLGELFDYSPEMQLSYELTRAIEQMKYPDQ